MNVLEKILEEIDTEVQKQRELCKGLKGTPGYRLYVKVASVFKGIIMKYMDEVGNDGWIPVEERLPGEGQKVLVWYEYCRYGEYNRMLKTYGIGWLFDGHWGGDVSGTKARCIAWQPLPEPYRRFKKELS